MDQTNRRNLMLNKRLLLVMAFGFSSGLPFALTGSTLQAWFTEAHINLMAIGFFSLITFPYNCKFLWAPLLDRFGLFNLGRRRSWILLMQLGLALAFFTLADMQPETSIKTIGWLALLIAFMSATQDVVVDAYRADTLLPAERGLGVSYFIFAYRIAMFVSGGLAMVLASYWGWAHTYQFMGGIMLVNMVVTYFAPEKSGSYIVDKDERSWTFFVAPFKDLWKRENAFSLGSFIVLYKLGAALSVALLTNFLLHDLGFSLIEIGVASKIVSIVGNVLGALVGGIFMTRLGLYASLLWFGLAQAFSILFFMALAASGKVFSLMMLSLLVENFCSGMSAAALVAFCMSLCNPKYSATQFAFLAAIDSLGRLFSGPIAAGLVDSFGWVSFYGWSFAACFPALIILMMLRKKVEFGAQAVYS